MNSLGIDVGTTSLKAALYNEKLEEIAATTLDYTLDTDGVFAEFEPEDYWNLLQKAMEDIGYPGEIASMAVDTQCETLILTDEAGVPVRRAIVWIDNRAEKQAEQIRQAFGNQKVYEVTGQPEITATWPASKLLWVQQNEPEVWAKTKKIFLLEDYLLYRLTGEFVTEKTLQSSSLYFDIRTGIWWKEMLDYIGIEESMLPALKDSGEVVGSYQGITVVTSAMDQAAAAIGAGIHKGIISEMTGTTMVLFVPVKEIPPYQPDSIIPCHYHADGSYALVLWTAVAGMALKWFRNQFCETLSFKELDELAEQVPAGSEGLTFLPHLYGSTMPKYNPEARGAFSGITLSHTRGHFVRAILESVACMLKSNLDYLKEDINEIRAMGGGASSPLWCQIKADVTGKRLVTLKQKETACLGSAILAGCAVGMFDSVEKAWELLEEDRTYQSSGMDYKEVYQNYIQLDDKLN